MRKKHKKQSKHGIKSDNIYYVERMEDGAEQVTLSVGQLPSHSHPLNIKTAAGDISSPANAFWAANDSINQYSSNPPNGLMNSAAISSTGNNVAHENMMPYLCISFIICLQNGIFPNRN
ncbi:MAG: hypothetical protein PHD40_06045 [Syntrophomonadaceae bacterium]|nr:hypothetical protein [Syntrophomonadaceae bacterium]